MMDTNSTQNLKMVEVNLELSGVENPALQIDESVVNVPEKKTCRKDILNNVDNGLSQKPKNELADPEPEEFSRSKFPQILASSAALLGALSYGTVFSFSAVAMPSLRHDAEIGAFPPTTETQISWISSIITLGAMAVGPPAGVTIDRFGRKKTIIMLSIPFLLGWLLIYFADNFEMLMAGRFITGFCGGAFSFVAQIFIAEISQKQIRGMLLCGYDITTCLGILFILTLGTFVDWRTQALVCCLFPVLSFFILFFVPESPRYLLSQGFEDQAFKSLCWFRGARKSEENLVKPEFHTLVENIEQDKRESSSGWEAKWRELKTRPVLKAVFISFFVFVFQAFCGITAVDFYVVDIFKSAGTNIDPHLSAIVMSTVGVVTAIFTASIIDRCGRRTLLMASEAILAGSMTCLGVYFYVKEHDPEFALKYLNWLPLIAITTLMGGFGAGLGAIPYMIMPEILPQRVRGFVSAAMNTVSWGMNFIVGRYFKDLMNGLGDAGGYWLFALISTLGFIFVFFFLPETKGKSLEEIQKEMTASSGKKRKNNDCEI